MNFEEKVWIKNRFGIESDLDSMCYWIKKQIEPFCIHPLPFRFSCRLFWLLLSLQCL